MAETRTFPRCGSDDYEFRSRKKTGQETITRYRCRECGEEWKVAVAK
jgi:transposase-like protein